MTSKIASKKRAYSFRATPVSKLKNGVATISINSAARLQDQELIFRAFWQCLIDKDVDSFKDILRSHLDAMNKRDLARRSKISRRTLHRMLSKEGNPTLESISRVIHALYA